MNKSLYICIYMVYMVFITEGFSEVALESCPEWDLNRRSLNSVQKLEPTLCAACCVLFQCWFQYPVCFLLLLLCTCMILVYFLLIF